MLGPFLPLCRAAGAPRRRAGRGRAVEGVEVEFLGRIAERDTRPLAVATLLGVLAGPHRGGRQRGQRAGAWPRSAGSTSWRPSARARATSPTSSASRSSTATAASASSGTVVGRRNRPHLLEAWGQRFNLQLEDHVALFRYRDVPGMLGRVGTAFGEQGVNIDAAAVGHAPDDDDGDGVRARGHGRHDRRGRPPGRRGRRSWPADGFDTGRAVALT